MRTQRTALLVAVVSLLALGLVGAAGGISGGTPDTTAPYRYPSVGMIEVNHYFGDFWLPACTGTLISPKVVLTAGHCTVLTEFGIISPADLRVTFDPAPQTIYFPERGPTIHYDVTAAFTDPDYLTANPPRGNSKAGYGAAPDVGVLILADPVPNNVAAPMQFVGADALGRVKAATVTDVGYGYNGFSRGAFGTPSAVPEIDGFRNYADTTVLTDHDTVSGLFLKVSSVSCSGDSGSPLMLGTKIAAVDAFGQSRSCNSPGFATRLDTEGVQAFLTDVLTRFGS